MSLTINPIPQVYGILMVRNSPWEFQNKLEFKSFLSNLVLSITRSLGSKTISKLWYLLIYENI